MGVKGVGGNEPKKDVEIANPHKPSIFYPIEYGKDGTRMIVSSRVSNATIREAIPALYTDKWSGPVDRRIIVSIQ